MANKKAWVQAMRLRTLPLSLSGIIIGSGAAVLNDSWDLTIFTLAICTTVLFQILSNFANDLGDAQKGTDNDQRIGPTRAIQSGAVSQKQMKTAVVFTAIISLIFSGALIYFGTQNMPKSISIFYIILAILSVIAAITYTVGKKAYGYNGLGDLMVFFFFGIVSVYGVFSLYTKSFDSLNIFLALFVGLLSAAVLNLNNMRDIENDANSNKKTLVVKIGSNFAKIYHVVIVLVAILSLLTYISLKEIDALYLCTIPAIFLILHLRKTAKTKEPQEFDPELKKVAITTFFISILFFAFSFTV